MADILETCSATGLQPVSCFVALDFQSRANREPFLALLASGSKPDATLMANILETYSATGLKPVSCFLALDFQSGALKRSNLRISPLSV